MSFTLSKAVNPSKIFIEQKTNVTGRWDPFYFRPELVALEKRVRKVTPHRLREFVCSMAGGATPSTTEAETHYTDSAEGVPFIRVQNLSTTGRLNLDDCKRITHSTHEGLLKRSRLSGGELLVKITGVGRMAVASVVPEGFEGNINQHMVAIRTKDIATSETLAAYINLDIAERLASRRSTGGTRPALDYSALLSIPVVFNKRIPELMQAAVKRHQEQIKKAEALLTTIDDVLLDELGIPRTPEPLNTLESRIFMRMFREVTGKRFDPSFSRGITKIKGGKYPSYSLGELATLAKGNNITSDEVVEGEYPVIAGGQTSPYSHIKFNASGDVITVSASGAYSGYIWYHAHPIFASDCTVIRSKNNEQISTLFLFEVMKLKQKEIYSLQTGSGQPHVYPSDLARIKIPLPPRWLQDQLTKRINKIRWEVSRLRDQARADLEKAKRDIEALILGKEAEEREKARVANLETVQEE